MLNETNKYSGREIYEAYRRTLEYEHKCLIDMINSRKEKCDSEFYSTHSRSVESAEDALQGMITLMVNTHILTESVEILGERQRVREMLSSKLYEICFC